jgi:hypothetical protein
MKFLSLEPFVPSGKNFVAAKDLFRELGFNITWDNGDLAGFEKDGCKFILQQYDDEAFAQNYMLSVRVTDIIEFREMVMQKKLPEKFGIQVSAVNNMPYGKEVNIIDMAGVCWHFIESK